ncbi:M1 family metallopeptidase [Ureibacillus sinduriensis]|uniref:Peptidase M1 membrane alanine aminopeptidase domain-containing protein n=1 Tax=Ureibacillus sinduriensis BLB-1 = JCM 15800 TaxID=1384057 RepID=A0A0A3ISZ2_9BACL|nr:M1 family metallopeptidase [Ureibacillus sinduriensis]KGR77947.1 hypothetical protein CD33_01860 [Ureibacillus sinduriensis BLB-1 = JCM 15800]
MAKIQKKLIIYGGLIIILLIGAVLIKNNTPAIPEKPTSPNQVSNSFKPKNSSFGTNTKYEIQLTMDLEGRFNVKSTSSITNISNDEWNEIVFYFIPKIFTKENSPYLQKPSTVNVDNISINGESRKFTLDKDTLTVPLDEKLYPNKEIEVEVSYDFTLPEEGFRFTEDNGNYYLAQWYPMVATYKDGWNKANYLNKGETYHTAFSDFQITYDIPENFTVVSTSNEELVNSPGNSLLRASNVKEFYIAILNTPYFTEKKMDNVDIRIFGMNDNSKLYTEIGEIASNALTYFQEKIGPYPHEQLDIIVDQTGMEYPGVITVGSLKTNTHTTSEVIKRLVVHEIAHQWFYGVVSNDPYHDAWLDEAITELSSSLFYADYEKTDVSTLDIEIFKDLTLPVNLPLDQYSIFEQSNYIYGKSTAYLWNLFSVNGGKESAEDFLKKYYTLYKYKDVDTQEFARFLKYYLKLNDDDVLTEFLLIE